MFRRTYGLRTSGPGAWPAGGCCSPPPPRREPWPSWCRRRTGCCAGWVDRQRRSCGSRSTPHSPSSPGCSCLVGRSWGRQSSCSYAGNNQHPPTPSLVVVQAGEMIHHEGLAVVQQLLQVFFFLSKQNKMMNHLWKTFTILSSSSRSDSK